MDSTENVVFKNEFGNVTDKRVILNYKSGVEDIPIGQISSISLKHKRNNFFAIGSFAIAVVAIIAMLANIVRIPGAGVLIIIVIVIFAFLSGIANWIGHHEIVISTSGQNRKGLKVEMAKTKEGRQFVDAIRKAIFK
ncbi:MAG: hypothetical protein ABIQ40_19840 [Bacteroidia bacterium]